MSYRARYGRPQWNAIPAEDKVIEADTTPKNSKLIIHHIAWSPLYRKMLLDYCIPSLIEDVKLLIKEKVAVEWVVHMDVVGEQRKYEGVDIKFYGMSHVGSFEDSIGMARKSQKEGAYIALIAPDNIFGKDSLYNAFKLAQYKDTSIAIAHPRVLVDNFMAKYPAGQTYTNRELVKMAMKPDMMHPALKYAFDDLDDSFTNQGISIRRMGKGVYGVVHTLPSGIIFKFNKNDIDYLNEISWGEIDRGLNIKLFAEKRIKLVGCSDMCFFIELTRPTHNFSHTYPNMKNNDKHMDARQNIFNNTIVIWTSR